MTIEEAIQTALEYESRVHAAYLVAASRSEDVAAKRVFAVLADEERGHITYLQGRLLEWQREGRLSEPTLRSVLPSAEQIKAGIKRLRSKVRRRETSAPALIEALRKALAAEDETSAFYERMVAELPEEGRALFARFLEIEAGHGILAQAELDSLTKSGFCFDVAEFELEAS
jgi:rubrerythrin